MDRSLYLREKRGPCHDDAYLFEKDKRDGVAGLIITPVFWDDKSHIAGAFTLEAGLYIFQVLALIIVTQHAQEHPSSSGLAINVMLALAIFNQITRLLSSFLIDSATIGFEEVSMIAFVSLGIIVCLVTAFFFLFSEKHYREKEASWGVDAEGPACATVTSSQSGLLAQNEKTFSLCFAKPCEDKQLTQCEQEVLFEAVYGYTIDNIADKLCLSRETVKTYLTRAYAHAGVNNKQGILHLIDSSERL